MNTTHRIVHVRVNDFTTAQPTPVRIRFTGPAGEYIGPLGLPPRVGPDPIADVYGGNLAIEGKTYAYVDGTCEIQLPSGSVAVEISKGPEYLAARHDVELGAGKLALRLAVKRWIDLRREGWFSGDTEVFGPVPHAALVEGAAEDVAIVNLLAADTPLTRFAPGTSGTCVPNLLAFSGQHPALERPGHMVVVNTQNSHPVLGTLNLLNCHRVVYPLRFGGPNEFDHWTLADWCDQCHRKGGLVIWSSAGSEHPGSPHPAGEALADMILGKIDAFSTDGLEAKTNRLALWYDLLNAGFRVPLVAGSRKTSSQKAVGAFRTYARLQHGEKLSYKAWIEAVRAGRTFVTSGPLLSLTVNGEDPGKVVCLPAVDSKVQVKAEAKNDGVLGRLELLANGNVIADVTNKSPGRLEVEINLSHGGWLAARCDAAAGGAHTSPVYIEHPGNSRFVLRSACESLARNLDDMTSWIRQNGRFASESQRERLANIFLHAQQTLLTRAHDGLAGHP